MKWNVKTMTRCCFLLIKSVFGLQKAVLFICVYRPPTGSPYCRATSTLNGTGALGECLAEVQLSNDVHILLCGEHRAFHTKLVILFSRLMSIPTRIYIFVDTKFRRKRGKRIRKTAVTYVFRIQALYFERFMSRRPPLSRYLCNWSGMQCHRLLLHAITLK